MRVVLFMFFCCIVHLGVLTALKCDIAHNNGDQIKQALSACMKNSESAEKLWEMTIGPGKAASAEVETVQTDSKARHKRDDNSTKSSSTEETTTANPTSTNSSEECVVHCVLAQMELVDVNNLPDHSKITEGLLRGVNQRELYNFLQDSIDECYQAVNEANNLDLCGYSNKLVKCLADKGKSNCADWPAGALPF
ncbi:unnamed protein product [Phyllotreta striolata]|uniref:Uncharacterized protein n=1 Tax=Phyllotreta striolata TaxID=444603 RepID=A0A9N9TJ69_PHYSR|nr:unnamed protein product [Phyllotreta striolata]